MDTGSFKGRTSHFSWQCLFSRPFRTGWLFFVLMALIAPMEPAQAVCPDSPSGPGGKCCTYYMTTAPRGPLFVGVGEAGSTEGCVALAQPIFDGIVANLQFGACRLPGVSTIFPPIRFIYGSSWEQDVLVRYRCFDPGVVGVRELAPAIGKVWVRWPDDPCTIQLTGPGGTDGALADVEPGRQVSGLNVEVLCNGVPTPKQITITLTAVDNSGGHQHVPGRPAGSLLPASGTTPLTLAYTAPAVSGDYTITAKCADDSCGEATGKVWVGVKGLVNIPSSGFWNLYGDTGIHPAGHYLTGDAFGKLMDLARLYKQVYFPLNTPVLQLNDASLERGGVFDIDFVGRTAFWTPPHAEHQRGVVVDIQANGSATAIPRRNFRGFQELLLRQNMTWRLEQLNQPNGHYHVRLLGVAQ